MKYHSATEHNTLHSLAKRKYPLCLSWHKIGEYPITCLICNESMTYGTVYEHGLQHLREHNLLPFI